MVEHGKSFGAPGGSPGSQVMWHVGSSMDIQFAEIEVFAPKAEAAWTGLRRQYASRISASEIDHLFACFVLGLTSPAYAEQEPALHFDICRALVATKLTPERTEAALRAVPEPTQPWVASACDLIEKQGAKIGLSLREKARDIEDFLTAEASDAAHQGASAITRENQHDQMRRGEGTD
jgi:hypothetical protein